MIPAAIRTELLECLGWSDFSFRAMGGGDINQVFLLRSGDRSVVLKLNSTHQMNSLFRLEQQGLEAIAATQTILTPEVFGIIQSDSHQALLLSYHPPCLQKSRSFWKLFGRQLAEMNRFSSHESGWREDNYIGWLPQFNKMDSSWVSFYREQRIWNYAMRAKSILGKDLLLEIELLCDKLNSIIPDEKSSLLHGDLWSGNYLCSEEKPFLIDPAVYFGHREVDIAMTKLFGGFEESFYLGYNESFKLDSDWEERVGIYQLYPLLVHVNLFGSTYVNSVRETVKQYL